jgi:hypothetical protein
LFVIPIEGCALQPIQQGVTLEEAEPTSALQPFVEFREAELRQCG